MFRKKEAASWSALPIVVNVLAIGVAGVGAAYALRKNNLEMLRLREAVIQADEKQQGTTESLAKLQSFVTTHMNTELPRLGSQPAIQLKVTYSKLVEAEQQRVSSERQRIASEATQYCEANVSGYLSNRAACVAAYTADRPVSEATIQPDLYRYNFSSPSWSPDAAGFFLLALVGLVIVLVMQVFARIAALFMLHD